MWCIKGRVVPMASDHSVAPDTSAAFAGRVWIGDDGNVAAVTRGRAKGPAGSDGAPVVDVGTSLVIPGLVDLHNHLAYNTLPLWTEPKRTTPWPDHNSWTRAESYAASTTWPAYALITACPEELLAFVEVRALVGGTTSIQGSPPSNKPRDGWMVRNIEDETFGGGDPNRVYASVLTLKGPDLAARANQMRTTPTRTGSTFIYHCGEGQLGSIVQREYSDAAAAGCLQPNFVAVHANSVSAAALATWSSPGAIAWSPFSNLWLYGQTTQIPAARSAGIKVCLGSDWAPSGTKHVLGEAKVARAVADHNGWSITDQDIVEMMTCNPGDELASSWGRQIGRLQPGAIADVVVLDTKPRAEPFSAIVAAVESQVQLVVVAGKPLYGTADLMTAAGASNTTAITVGGEHRRLALTRPVAQGNSPEGAPWTWSSVTARINAVRKDPAAAVRAAQNAMAPWAGRIDEAEAPLRLALDMPTGLAPVGGLPKDLGAIVVPPLPSLTHDAAWLRAVAANPFHGGVLDALADYYA
jgi:cytosine/adenosine deaminase-related metal-dependent hydrolase